MPARNHIPSSPVMKQGIVTILGSDCDRNKSSASIRRTLSADMSSKKWLEQNGFFSPSKKATSSSSSSSSSEGDEEFDRTPGDQDDVWSSIVSRKSKSSPLPPPYVHPLVKRSFSSMSARSLEMCTESLGSETGSDCFSYNCSTECLSDDSGDEACGEDSQVAKDYFDPFADLDVVKYRASPARPIPPPLPSIAAAVDGAPLLHMQSRRENGRLIVEAVSVAPRNYLHARRVDGRLVLTLVRGEKMAAAEGSKKVEDVFENMEDVGEAAPSAAPPPSETVDEEEEFVVEKKLSLSSGMMMSVNKSRLVTKKFVAVGNMNMNMNATWTNKEEEISIPQSLPPLARLIQAAPPAAASFNAYEYFWRNKTGGFGSPIVPSPEPIKNRNDNNNNNSLAKAYENRDLVVMKGNNGGDQFVPCLRGCKEPRRSLLLWEPYCIATS